MRGGATAEMVASWNANDKNGKLTAEAWRAIEASFFKYVPQADAEKAYERFTTCLERLAGAYIEPGALDKPKTEKPAG